MSISEFFNKKARAVVAASAIGLAGLGGYAGSEIAQQATQPQLSTYTLSQIASLDEKQVPESVARDIARRQFFPAALPDGVRLPEETVIAQREAVRQFTQRIDALAAARAQGSPMLFGQAADFIDALRLSGDLSERDYARLLSDYNHRVGIDVSGVTGNYDKGISWQQEASLAVHFAEAFGGFFDDDEDMTPQQMSREIGAAMQQGQDRHDGAAQAGGLAGGAAGFMLLVPLWLRLRRAHPRIG